MNSIKSLREFKKFSSFIRENKTWDNNIPLDLALTLSEKERELARNILAKSGDVLVAQNIWFEIMKERKANQ